MRSEYFRAFLAKIDINDIEITAPESFLETELSDKESLPIVMIGSRIVNTLSEQKVAEDSFYQQLWEKLSDVTLLPDETAKMVFLCFLWLDKRIPYYKIGNGVILTSEGFERIVEKMQPEIKKEKFIVETNLEYKTKRSSLLLETAEGLADKHFGQFCWPASRAESKHCKKRLLSRRNWRRKKRKRSSLMLCKTGNARTIFVLAFYCKNLGV